MDEMGFESCKADPDIWFIYAMEDDGTDFFLFFGPASKVPKLTHYGVV